MKVKGLILKNLALKVQWILKVPLIVLAFAALIDRHDERRYEFLCLSIAEKKVVGFYSC